MNTHLNYFPDFFLNRENINLLFPETMQDLVCLHKMDGEYIYVSPSVKHVLGYTAEELISTFGYALMVTEKLNIDDTETILINADNNYQKYLIRKKDGTHVWFETFARLLTDPSGQPAYLQTTSRLAPHISERSMDKEAPIKQTDNLLHKMTESAPLACYIADEHTNKILHFNTLFCQMWGLMHLKEKMLANELNHDQLLSLIISLLKQPEDFNTIRNLSLHTVNQPATELETDLISGLTYKIYTSQILDDTHQYFATLFTFEDITQRKKSDKKLKSTFDSLAEAQKIARFGNWEFDLQTREIVWSEELFGIYGLPVSTQAPSFEEMLKRIHPEDTDAFIKAVENCMHQGIAYDIDHRIVLPDETARFIHCIGKAVIAPDGIIIGIKGISHEITRQKQTEEQLIKAKELAEHSVKLKEQFLANMSHEIRTPLNGIVGMSHLLSKTALNQEQKQFMEAIKFSADNLMVIINDILDLAKIEAGKMHIEEAPLFVRQIVKNVAGIFGIKTAEKRIQLDIDIDDMVPESLLGDPVRLNQILLNLVGNAVKFTEEGFVKIKVKIDNEWQDQVLLKFDIIDTGIGIPEDKLDYIFEIFTQATNETTRKFGGTGLGLPICKKLIELQKGKIKVTSQLGKGSEFSFIIPYTYKREKLPTPDSKMTMPASEFAPLPENMRILLAEDNEINRLIVLTMLKKWKQIKTQVDVAANGHEVINMLNKQEYDLILMDCQMPDMDGYTATRIIRTQMGTPTSNTPIIAITASALQQDKEKVFESGMDDFIPKPFEQAELFDKILLVASRKTQINTQSLPAFQDTEENFLQEGLFDLTFLRSLAADDVSELNDIITKFIEKLPYDISQMEEALDKKQYKALSGYAHKLKANIKFFGIEKLYIPVEQLEKARQEDEALLDIHALRHHIATMKLTSVKVIAGLKKEIKENV